jgi:hypothetical protein
VWRALERMGATRALVRFTGAGRQGKVENISIQADENELAGWPAAREGELARALGAPIWWADTAASAVSHRSPRRSPGTSKTVRSQSRADAEASASKKPSRPRPRLLHPLPRDMSRDTSLSGGGDRKGTPRPERQPQPATRAGRLKATARVCCRCGQAIAATARPEARYCSKLSRQAASRARLREQSGRSALKPPDRCAWCDGPMSKLLRPEARYCSKRCRQAASRARLALALRRGRATNASASPSPQLGLK